jgi:glycosyltransferase involved in cell wall biosynthesis
MFSWESLHSICAGGAGVHVTELAAALERRGNEVHVFTRLGHGQSHYQVIEGVHYHRCPFQLDSYFPREIDNMCRSFVHHYFECENYSGRFDAVHSHDWLAAPAAVWAKWGRGVKAVLTMHSTEYGRCGNNFWGGVSADIRDRERWAAWHVDRVITVSRALRDEVAWIYEVPGDKMRVIYNGVNLHAYDGWIDQGEVKQRFHVGPFDPMILFVGRLTTQKGPDILARAIPFILWHWPQARFVFAGDGDLRGLVEEIAWRSGVHWACRFVGHFNSFALRDLYRAADMVVVPSRNEPFGIVILEAWSAGKPVVASQSGGPKEFVWHEVTGIKVDANESSVAWGISRLLQEPEFGRWLGHNGRVAAESVFSWDSIAAQAEEVYRW